MDCGFGAWLALAAFREQRFASQPSEFRLAVRKSQAYARNNNLMLAPYRHTSFSELAQLQAILPYKADKEPVT